MKEQNTSFESSCGVLLVEFTVGDVQLAIILLVGSLESEMRRQPKRINPRKKAKKGGKVK